MNNKDLIKNLTDNLEPTQKLPSALFLSLKWLSITVLCLFVFAVIAGLRKDIDMMAYNHYFIFETLLGLIASLIAGYLSFCFMRPDFKLTNISYVLACASIGIWLYLISYYLIEIDFNLSLIAKEFINIEQLCSIEVFAFSIIPITYLFSILQKGAVIQKMKAGFLGVLSVASLSSITSRYTCSSDMPSHILAQHFLEVFIIGFIGILLAKKILKW